MRKKGISMEISSNSYEFIKNKIHTLKDAYPSLRNKSDAYVFSALSVKSNYYKNPALVLSDNDFEDIIVDGKCDGGVDILLSDPNSETSDLVIGQSKFYQSITLDDVINALTKMALFYKDMQSGHYENINESVQRRFLSLYSELGEDSRVKFVFYTSAPQSKIRRDTLENKFRKLFSDSSSFDIVIMFGPDIEEAIKESESRRPTVESGKIIIDKRNNYLQFGDDAAIVNVSALSIKSLYAQHSINLLARNLRYHIPGKAIDNGIKQTINDKPEMFWLKNNGITIVCDDFVIDGREVKLVNFSIVNGGQTCYILHRSQQLTEHRDFYLPCKVIKTQGSSEDEKMRFSLEIAKATNSQKAIKESDLKANSPEQVLFSRAMRECGIFYQTKRGETIPSDYKQIYKNSDIAEIGKLALSAIFQMPCTSRNKPSLMYNPKYYDIIFERNRSQIAELCKELLYIDYYFRKVFLKRFDSENNRGPDSEDKIAFAHNARTICTAFVFLVSRYYYGTISNDAMTTIFNASKSDIAVEKLYDITSNLHNVQCILPKKLFDNKDRYDDTLYKLFTLIINEGTSCYTMAKQYEEGLNATNYLKKDKNYYNILKVQWTHLQRETKIIFDLISK